MKVAAIDPGRSGYECMLDVEPQSNPNKTDPTFWPSPLSTKVTAKGEIVHDPDGDYDLAAMVHLAREWYAQGVRLVVLEEQAPRGHGTREQLKLGQGREGTKHAFTLGFGFGAWQAALWAANFGKADEQWVRETFASCARAASPRDLNGFFVVVAPRVWKPRMGALVSSYSGEDTHQARRKAANEQTIAVARRLDPSLDLLPVERGGGTKRSPSPDKAAAFLLARYGADWILRPEPAAKGSAP